MQDGREPSFRKNIQLENLLREINEMLSCVSVPERAQRRVPRYPVVLVLGCPRAGTTLLTQWLAYSGCFAYPSNFLSRFYRAPYVGARIQQMLTDPTYRFGEEFADFGGTPEYGSILGKTRGAWAPNEFWYFWRRFIPNDFPEHLEREALAQVDVQGFLEELGTLESAFDKPWAMKGSILQQNASFLSDILEKVVLLVVRRHPFYNMQSLLFAREKFFGSRETWYSVKPREYPRLQDLSSFDQVAGQVFHVNSGLDRELARVDPSRWMTVSYESFCEDPASVYEALVQRMAAQGYDLEPRYEGPAQFDTSNQVRLSVSDSASLVTAYQTVSGEDATP